VVFHEEALYQVYLPLPLPFNDQFITQSLLSPRVKIFENQLNLPKLWAIKYRSFL